MNGIVTGREKVLRIQFLVAECYEIEAEAMRSKLKPERYAHPRQVAMWLCRELTRLSLSEIGIYFGGRNHGTVAHACKTVKARAEAWRGYAQELRVIWGKACASIHGAHIKNT